MSKDLIPVLKNDFLFDLMDPKSKLNRYVDRHFRSGGSVPASKSFGRTVDCLEFYDFHKTYEFVGTLIISNRINASYGIEGFVLTNKETSSAYFMLYSEFFDMARLVIINKGEVSGKWKIFKDGHAFSLRYLGEK
jgi:hypothetical protein